MSNNNIVYRGEDRPNNPEERRPLRRPMEQTIEKMLNGVPGPPRERPILGAHSSAPNVSYTNQNQVQSNHHFRSPSEYGLSVNAAEFVPGIKYQLSAEATEFVPRFHSFTPSPAYNVPSRSQFPDPAYNTPMTAEEMENYAQEERLAEQFQSLVQIRPPHLQSSSTSSRSSPIEVIKSSIHYLTTNPGQADTYMKSVVDQLRQNTLDESSVSQIIESLIEQGISEPNFRYTGAKLCQYFCNHLELPKNQPIFKSAFLKRFGEEYYNKDEWIKDPICHQRLCGLTLFLGELFLNMEMEHTPGVTLKYGQLRSAIIDLLVTLLSNSTDLTVKTACQLLKLTGAAVEDTKHLNKADTTKSSFDDVFVQLQRLSQYPHLGKTSQLLISSVLSLRESNWGRRESTSSAPPTPPQSNPWDAIPYGMVTNEPVFYDSNGQPCTREQAGFYMDDLGEEFAEYAYDSGDVAYGEWASDDSPFDQYDYSRTSNIYGAEGDMTDEMEAAYEEYLRMQGQS